MAVFEGVVFDFNGTLFWDTKINNEAWNLFLRTKGIELSDKEKNEKIHGKNNKEILNSFFRRKLTNDEVEKFSLEKENVYQELCLETNMELAPGAFEFLSFLQKEGIKYTIATASDFYNVKFYFEQLKLDQFFELDKVVYNNGKIASKPNPEIFEKAIEVIRVEKSKVLIFEDSLAGIKAAENAGVGKIIIVNSNDDFYDDIKYQTVRNFNEVDKVIFEF